MKLTLEINMIIMTRQNEDKTYLFEKPRSSHECTVYCFYFLNTREATIIQRLENEIKNCFTKYTFCCTRISFLEIK